MARRELSTPVAAISEHRDGHREHRSSIDALLDDGSYAAYQLLKALRAAARGAESEVEVVR